MTPFLFIVVVIAWSFSWFALKLQLGIVPIEVSVFWRFLFAALVMWAGLAVTGRIRPARWRDHGWFAATGLGLFCVNFVLMYAATQYIASGVSSVVFTLATVFNAFNQWMFLGRRPEARALVGAALGVGGVALLFGDAFSTLDRGSNTALGMAMALGATYAFSLGNLASMRAAATGVDLPNSVARGMTWGAAFLGLAALVEGKPFIIDPSPVYIGSLAYLALIASVAAFLAYLSLIRRIGADRAAYTTVLCPAIALAISSVLENYTWTAAAAIGFPLILAGNIVIFSRGAKPKVQAAEA